MKIERGVMIMKGDGLVWGHGATRATPTDGWVPIESGTIYDPKQCKKPTDATFPGSRAWDELSAATIVPVVRKTDVETWPVAGKKEVV